jgi:UPF0716 family protein affecting phage T7 exclusion
MLIISGILLVYPKALFDAIGIVLLIAVVVMQYLRRAKDETAVAT